MKTGQVTKNYNWFNILEFWDQAKALNFKSL